MNKTVDFSYEEFNTTTRRDANTRAHGRATIKQDPDGGLYLVGSLGCSKTRPDIQQALHAYLGGRQLICWSVND